VIDNQRPNYDRDMHGKNKCHFYPGYLINGGKLANLDPAPTGFTSQIWPNQAPARFRK